MKGKVKGEKSTTMVAFIWENLRGTKQTGLQFIQIHSSKTMKDTKEIGLIARNRVMVSTNTLTVADMKGTG